MSDSCHRTYMLLLLVSYLLFSSASDFYCQPRWLPFQGNCYRRLEESAALRAKTCKNFGSVMVGTVTGLEKEFIANISQGGPLATRRGDFICKKAASATPITVQRKRPSPRNELDCAGKEGWYGLQSTNKCYASLYSLAPITWTQANDNCANLYGGTLAMLKTPEEHDHVLNVGHEGVNTIVYEHPRVGLRRDGTTWKWVDGTSGGYMNWAVGEPNLGGSSACGRLITDMTVTSQIAPVFGGVFGALNDIDCDMLLLTYMCSVDQPTFVARFRPTTTTTTTTPTTTEGPRIYCEPRFVYADGFCYRDILAYDVYNIQNPCSLIGSTEYTIPDNTNIQYLKNAREFINYGVPIIICRKPASSVPQYGRRMLPIPQNDFDCFLSDWYGFLGTGQCYKLFRYPQEFITWSEAAEICRSQKAHLAYIDVTEKEFLTRLGHLGSPAFLNEALLFSYHHSGYDPLRLITDEPIAHSKRIGDVDDRLEYSHYFICKADYEQMRKNYGPIESGPVSCPSYSTLQRDRTCRCNAGYTDALETNMPNVLTREKGMLCIYNDPCNSASNPKDVFFLVEQRAIDTTNAFDLIVNVQNSISNLRKTIVIYYNAEKWTRNDFTRPMTLGDKPQGNPTMSVGSAAGSVLHILNEDNYENPVVISIVAEDWHTEEMRQHTTNIYNEIKQQALVMVVQTGSILPGSRYRWEWVSVAPYFFFDYTNATHPIPLGQDLANNMLMYICAL